MGHHPLKMGTPILRWKICKGFKEEINGRFGRKPNQKQRCAISASSKARTKWAFEERLTVNDES